jgi:hypothetical protein
MVESGNDEVVMTGTVRVQGTLTGVEGADVTNASGTVTATPAIDRTTAVSGGDRSQVVQ